MELRGLGNNVELRAQAREVVNTAKTMHDAWLREQPSRYYAVYGVYPTSTVAVVEDDTVEVASLMRMINKRRG